MDRNAIAFVLEEIGALLEIQGENRFKSGAFNRAARAVAKTDEDLGALLRQKRLQAIPGIGPATASVVRELLETGASSYHQQLREQTPPGLLQLLGVPQLGVTRIRALHGQLGIASLDDLETAAQAGRIADVPGFGARTQSQILEGIAQVRAMAGRRRYFEALDTGERLLAFAAALPGVRRAVLAGELRRGCETVNRIEIVAEIEASPDPDAAGRARRAFLALAGFAGASEEGGAATAHLANGLRVRFTPVAASAYATTLLAVTGSPAHLARLADAATQLGLRLTSDALLDGDLALALGEETDLYARLGLEFVPPELRESGAEIEVARAAKLPRLIEQTMLRGCFHCHTTWSDGRATVAEMAEAALERGWRYLGIADHSQYAGYAGGLSPGEIVAQHAEIDAWNEAQGRRLWLFKGIEADILPDGRLDYEDRPDLLARFDYVVGSVHSAFTLPRAEQTQRYLRVIENPYLTFFGHLTGRLLLTRRGCDIDVGAVLRAAARRGIGIEINSDPHRMELDWRYWPQARSLGIATAINPDAHSPAQLDYVRYGVVIARKGWLDADAVVNCWPLERVQEFLRSTRRDRT